ncbi:MAG TPA: exodeoxyribonuclease VII large subunit [Nocardioidaceae bacterium]|nr:exodeoxyribonuclease VII large subunit [Nocardioidaceae bacterium]
MALQTSPESPAAVRQIAQALGGWIARLGWVWVEGQISQLNLRQGMVFLTLRDCDADISLQVTCPRRTIDASPVPVTEGARVVVHARPTFYDKRGTLSLRVDEIRPVGVGELLARLEQRRRLLAAEGLFDPALKRRLPFLPHTIGLITGRASAAERDVLQNARNRWPGVRFRIRYATMQGSRAAAEVIGALRNLDDDPEVDVVIIARGGGSVEDLLPFSDEALIRAAAKVTTVIVSAIGHEPDSPILDLVADVRASTPTDAAKQVVPDVAEESQRIQHVRERIWRHVRAQVDRELHVLDQLRSRPALAAPVALLDERRTAVVELRDRARRHVTHRLDRASDDVDHQLARIRALSPLATMRRGYAVVRGADGHVVSSADAVAVGDVVDIRLADGAVHAKAETVTRESEEIRD